MPSPKQKVVAMSLSPKGYNDFNQQGYLEVEVNAEETGSPTTPPPDGAAADGVSRPERQQQGRRGLMQGTKRGCSRCQEAHCGAVQTRREKTGSVSPLQTNVAV